MTGIFAAVDLGAASGRVMLARVAVDRLDLTEVHRFANRPVSIHGTLHWDILALYRGVLDGLHATVALAGRLDGIGIDSWGVDYGLFDKAGNLLGNPVHYRDNRTKSVIDSVEHTIPHEQMYAATGTGFQPFNTVFQLAAARGDATLRAASRLLLIPDLISYWLTGEVGTEITNASTTGLFDVTTETWATSVTDQLGIDSGLFGPLRRPGERAGELLPEVAAEIGLENPATASVQVYAVGSHDTASAVAGVPASDEMFGYISSGTWSLVGLELPAPVITESSRVAGFTNEIGVDDTIRYLRNVTGLWLLQECQRTWFTEGTAVELTELLREAARLPGLRSVIDATENRFLAPGDMPTRIRAACKESGQPEPETHAELTRCVLDSLAMAHRRSLLAAAQLTGREINIVHIVGGGSHNSLLCRLTAEACGIPVVAGPTEAAALGNILIQARASGVIAGGLPEMRELLAATQEPVVYQPGGDERAWAAHAAD